MNWRTIVVAVVFLGAAVLLASPAAAQITSVTVRVDGLSCPFCAYSLEKKIKSVEGTKAPVINVEQGVVTLRPVGDVSVDFDGLREAVKKAGFTPREISVEGIGRVVAIDKRPILVAEDGQQLFFLVSNDVLTELQTDAESLVTFRGSVAPREKDDDGRLQTLVLLSARPRADGDVN